ncbi:MAG: hypothetical protein AB8B58_14020, partial [Roseobacter sp.]
GLGGADVVTINQARDRALEYRRMAKAGLNPRFNAKRDIPSFEEFAKQVHIDRMPTWKNAKHGQQWINTLRDYAFPKIGRMPIDSIDQPEVMMPWIPNDLVNWFTGKYLLQGRAVEMKGPLIQFFSDVGLIVAMVGAIAWAWSHLSPGWALLAGYYPTLILVGSLRKMQTLYGHEGSPGHDNFFPRGHWLRGSEMRIFGMSLNDFFAALATSLALSQNEEDYGKDHGEHHALETFGTLKDADARAIFDWGFRPGMSVGALWLRFWWTMASPGFHMRMLVARAKSNWHAANLVRRIMALFVASVLASLALVMPVEAWLAAVLMPWSLLFHISGLVQVLNRHAWLETSDGYNSVETYAEAMVGRFNGISLPERDLKGLAKFRAWSFWWTEVLLLELPIRLFSWSPDLQAHDFHHLEFHGPEPFVDDWTTMPQRRQEAINKGRDPYGMQNRELWGWRSAMKNSLKRLNQAQDVA